jgi:hypothetical protein
VLSAAPVIDERSWAQVSNRLLNSTENNFRITIPLRGVGDTVEKRLVLDKQNLFPVKIGFQFDL